MEQEKRTEKNKALRWAGGLIRGLMILLFCALIYVGMVLLESPEARMDDNWTVVDDDPVPPLQAVSSSDAGALARLLGAPIPALRGKSMQGQALNLTHDGQTVRQVILDYGDLRITALRPASAAPLLLEEGLSVRLQKDLTVMNMPAVLSEGDGRYCIYFSSTQAAYSVSGKAESASAFLGLVHSLSPVQ